MSLKRGLYLLLFGGVVILIDFLTKSYVACNLPLLNGGYPIFPYGGIAVFQDWHGVDFSIVHVHNYGAAWGMFANFQEYLFYLRLVLIGGILSYLFFSKEAAARQAPLMLIISGATGNVIDTMLYGHVIDMFYFVFWGYSYPVFNVADSAIFCGIAWLLFQSFFKKTHKKKKLAAES